MEEKRTKFVIIRMTEKEVTELKAKASNFQSLTQYIREALTEFSTVGIRERIDLLNALAKYYRSYQYELSKIGINLNQSVKRANELAVAGHLSEAYIKNILLPSIEETKARISEIQDALYIVTAKAEKFK